MLVLVTGGTGFIGSHSIAAILAAGHRVRMLVRDPGRVWPALRPLGVDPTDIELVTGDATRESDVSRAVDGTGAVLHAAGLYSFDSRTHGRMPTANVHATEVVIGAARSAGADPIVHVSTFGALLPAADAPLTTNAPVGTAREPYLASKIQAETIARRHQEEGAPVVITYPLATLGPCDPNLGDQLNRVHAVLRGSLPLWPHGGFPIGDVRDVARLHAAVLRPGLGPRRFFGPGRYVTTRGYLDALRRATGRALPAVHLPAAALLPAGALAGLAQRVLPIRLPVEYGAIYLCAMAAEVDNASTAVLLGTEGRPLDLTVTDTVRWLYYSGRIGRRAAGRVATEDTGSGPQWHR